MQEDVAQFHEKFGHPLRDRPGLPDIPTSSPAQFRVSLIREEVAELIVAIEDGAVPRVAAEAVDVLYVVLGTLCTYGIDVGPVWDAIHRANMLKVPNGADKPIKPPGWRPADVGSLICEQMTSPRR